MNLIFELTNEQRKYLGLIPVEENWELVKFDDNIYHYFEDDIIKKEITVSENYYHESELNEKTTENRTMILPKTKRGKIKKFNYTAVQSFSPYGTYFTFSTNQVIIANYTTQRTYYSESFPESENITIDDLKNTTDFPLRTLDVFNLQLENISSKNNDLLLQIDNVSYGDILLQISTSINKGDVIGLIGRNGAGKTTLLRMLTNIMNPTKGKILGNVKPFLVMQDMDYQFFTESVLSEIRFGNEGVENDKINNLLEELGLNKFKDKIPFELSGGQKQRLLISIAAISNVNLLMFDEPTSGLDYINMEKVSSVLKNLSTDNALIHMI